MGNRQGLSKAGPPTWLEGLTRPAHLPAVAIVSLGDPDLQSAQRLEPTDRDRSDCASRTGEAADRFFRRRMLLRQWIGLYLGLPADVIVVGYDASGRPALVSPGAGLFLSVSGRGDWAAFGLAQQPIGIDIEPLEGGPIASAVLSDREQTRIGGLGPAAQTEAFLRIWIVKEAYLKATGDGLNRDPALLEVTDRGEVALVAEARSGRPLGTAHLRPVEMDGRRFVTAAVIAPS